MPQIIAAVGRILLSLLFIFAGLGKIMAPSATIQYIAAFHLPLPPVAYVIAVIVEVGGGIALLLGWQARAVGVILALFTIVTAFVFHTNFADHNMQIHFMKNLAIAGGLLEVAAMGAGAFSIDRIRESNHAVGGVSGSHA